METVERDPRVEVPPPLRRVVGIICKPVGSMGGFVFRECLECGHEVGIKHDIYGETNAVRRRCKQCSATADVIRKGDEKPNE